MPPHMRDEPDKVIEMAVKVDFAIRFDSTQPLLLVNDQEVARLAAYSVAAKGPKPFDFEVSIVGNKRFFPTLGQLRLKHLALQVRAATALSLLDQRAPPASTDALYRFVSIRQRFHWLHELFAVILFA
uniref:Uncharacterized protein n=2 Tax=Chrysotila carterae TaxID=13221 RepID=A0A7S4B780_CHRCT